MKGLEKQIFGAVALGIGAGVMLNPVTAYANENEEVDNGETSRRQKRNPYVKPVLFSQRIKKGVT